MLSSERNELIKKIVENELIPILTNKGHDYSGEDVFSNFYDFGWKGVVVRLGDKYHRLKNFIKQQQLLVKDETVEDTIKDLINYGFICLLLYRIEKGDNNGKS